MKNKVKQLVAAGYSGGESCGDAARWRSCARWPKGTLSACDPPDTSDDTHDTRDQAVAVCFMLRRDGLGGNGTVFPLETWIEDTLNPQKGRIRT